MKLYVCFKMQRLSSSAKIDLMWKHYITE